MAPSLFAGKTPTPAGELLRLLKPCGGVAVVGQSPQAAPFAASPATVKPWVDQLNKVLADLGEKALEGPRPMYAIPMRLEGDEWAGWMPEPEHPLYKEFR